MFLLSHTLLFVVLKVEHNIIIVYNGTKASLNNVMLIPSFFLNIVSSLDWAVKPKICIRKIDWIYNKTLITILSGSVGTNKCKRVHV